MNRIITIGREFGSGGRELGKRIAEALNIAYYDKEILTEIARKTELAYDYVQKVIEKKPITNYPITIGNSFSNTYYSSHEINTSIYTEQCNVIRELANKSDCVIVGRCADYILSDLNPFRIFVYSDMPSKIKRCREKGELDNTLPDKKLARKIRKIDKQRGQYYRFYTSNTWGDKYNYDICINTSGKTVKEVVAELLTIIK